MTDINALIEQLRLRARFRDDYAAPFDPNLDNAAADEIERLRGCLDALASAIRAAAMEEAAKIVEAAGHFFEDHHGSDYAAGFSTGYNDALGEAATRIRAAKEVN